ncbi:MAG: DinB family protein [Gemmataceae bacterium]
MLHSATPRDALLFARSYSKSLLESIPDEKWFDMPGGITHVAWQVGHLAVAEWRLCLFRIRGPQPIDEEIFPLEYRRYFMTDDTPRADRSVYPSPARFREILDNVHQQTLAEWPKFSEAFLAEPALGPAHPICKTKADCLVWVAQHELIHSGQIGLLRRQLGFQPVW